MVASCWHFAKSKDFELIMNATRMINETKYVQSEKCRVHLANDGKNSRCSALCMPYSRRQQCGMREPLIVFGLEEIVFKIKVFEVYLCKVKNWARRGCV